MANRMDRLKAALTDRYAIEREIGAGGMAVVYLGRELKHGRRVAIKVLKPEIASSVSVERFHREIEVEASLAHPHIVPLHDSGEVDGIPFCVMPFMEGETLDARMVREGPLPIEEALRIARQVADALDYAHARGVVHRDIKPRNILLTAKHAVVADFGICRALTVAGGDTLTTSGIVVGTPSYMSPEQADPETPIDGRSDIYALGCMLYEMLVGEPPFTGPTAQVVISRHMSERVRSLRVARPEIPPEVEAITVKALAKLPADRYATGGEMAADLTAAERTSGEVPGAVRPLPVPQVGEAGGWRGWFTGWRRIALPLLVVVGVAVAIWSLGVLEPAEVYGVPDPRGSYVVLPWADPGQSDEERELARLAASRLTRQLRDWPLRAVQSFALDGKMSDLFGSRDPLALTPEQGFELAKSQLVGTLIIVQVELVRDSSHLEATLYDVATNEELSRHSSWHSRFEDVGRLVEPITLQILGLRREQVPGLPADAGLLETLVRESPVPIAQQDQQDGLDALYQWRLTDAEAHFRGAIASDPEFAAPRYYLALTLYWQTARNPQRIIDLGPEIAGLAEAASRLAAQRPQRPRLSNRVEALHAFWEGDYAGARDRLNTILEGDPSDSEAWLLLGAVEFNDPWLEEGPDGELQPRANLNLARRAFDRTVEMSPDFQLGYGHLFDINRHVTTDAVLSQCAGFERPGGPRLAPYMSPEAGDQVWFCAAALDSIVWIGRDLLDADTRARAREGADALEQLTYARVQRWADIQPDQPRPHEEWADWLVWRRSIMGCTGDPATVDSLTRRALSERELAFGLRGDTPLAPEDLVRLALLELAVGRVDSATRLADRALLERRTEQEPGAPPAPPSAANIYLATGRPLRALEILRPIWATWSVAAEDPASGERISGGDVSDALGLLRVLGPAGAISSGQGDVVQAGLELWASPGHTARQQAILREGALLWQGLAPAVALNDDLRAGWFDGWAEEGLEIAPVWQGLIAADSDPSRAATWLDPSLQRPEDQPRTNLIGHFLVGLLAQRVGRDSVAVEQFSRVDACAIGLDQYDLGWGLRNLSTLFKARSLDALGDTDGAAEARRRVAALWANAETNMTSLVQEASQVP